MAVPLDTIEIVAWYIVSPIDKKLLGTTIIKIKRGFFKYYYARWDEHSDVKKFLPGGRNFLGYTKKQAFLNYNK